MRRDLSRLSPLSSYSYTIHTVSPPRPLIPISRGGVQTGKQTGGWLVSLFIRCLTRWAWQSISHLQNFSYEAVKLWVTEILIHIIMCKCTSLKDAERDNYWIAHLTLQMLQNWCKLRTVVWLKFSFFCLCWMVENNSIYSFLNIHFKFAFQNKINKYVSQFF